MGRVLRPNFDRNANRRQDDGKQKVNWNAIREVRLIDENGDMVGVVPTSRALAMAREAELDLINISPNSNPPVCKICDYGKYQYEQKKKQKSNRSTTKLKEMQFTMNIGDNDLENKIKKIIEFLQDKNTVQLVMKLKGRDMARVDFAMEVMNKICERLKEYSKQIDEPKLTGRKIISLCR